MKGLTEEETDVAKERCHTKRLNDKERSNRALEDTFALKEQCKFHE